MNAIQTRLNDIQEWRKKNPLQVWRKENKISLRNAAVFLNVTLWTIQAWESGATFPNTDNLETIIIETGDKDMARKLEAWYSEKPRAA